MPEKSLEFYFVEDYGLNELADHEGKPALRKPESESMVVSSNRKNLTYDDFVCHFLGKKQSINSNTLELKKLKTGVEDFQFLKVIGTGGFSKVYLVKHKQTKELFALKSIKVPGNKAGKDKKTFLDQVKYEKQILMQLKHPFIVNLKYAFYEKRRFFLAMGLVQGGEFLPYISTSVKKNKEEM